jgi:phosphomannomutase
MIKFGTDGWREIISREFTFNNVSRVAFAVSIYLKKHNLGSKGILVGYDPRFLADKFAQTVYDVLSSQGIKCFITPKDTPTPVVAYAVVYNQWDGAVMLTASHNPPEYCGLKFIPSYGGPAFEEVTREIEENIPEESNQWSVVSSQWSELDPYPDYLSHIQKLIDFKMIKNANLVIVYDAMHGAGRGWFDRILLDNGIRVRALRVNRDVLFGGGMPDPVEKNLQVLKETMQSIKADLGFANDGDADRFAVFDEKGRFWGANQVIGLLLSYLVKDKGLKGSAVRSVATSHFVDKVAKRLGVEVVETPVGFKHIAKLMMKDQVIIGGEESGGLTIYGHIPEKDGILANLLILEMVAERGKSLGQLFDELIAEVGLILNTRISLQLDDAKKEKLMETFKSSPPDTIGGRRVSKIVKLDGVKMIFEDESWILIRPSGTEPIIRVYFETKSEGQFKELKRAVEGMVSKV